MSKLGFTLEGSGASHDCSPDRRRTGAGDPTWVSGVGETLTRAAARPPCKTYAGAISERPPAARSARSTPRVRRCHHHQVHHDRGHEGSSYGSILAAGTSGVIVNDSVGDANTAIVTLRNLSINLGGRHLRLRFIAGKALHVETVRSPLQHRDRHQGAALTYRCRPTPRKSSPQDLHQRVFG